MLGLVLNSCENLIFIYDKQQENIPITPSEGIFVLNNGNWGDSDSNIGVYDPVSKTFVADRFFAVNSQKLGDLGQDMLMTGDKVYIAVNGSQTIFVTDETLKVKRQISAEKNGARLSPRCLASAEGMVYVSYYEGYVGKLPDDEGPVVLTQVGPNPDGITVAGNNLYVANSGGMAYPNYGNTVSVVSLASFEETSRIEVNVNPSSVVASSDGTDVYVHSFGNYDNLPPCLEVIDTATGTVTRLDYGSVMDIAAGEDDILYILCGSYDSSPETVYRYDMATGKSLGQFISVDAGLGNAYSISVARDGLIYVGCSDYRTTGDVHVFTAEGNLHDIFDSCGLNPIKVY